MYVPAGFTNPAATAPLQVSLTTLTETVMKLRQETIPPGAVCDGRTHQLPLGVQQLCITFSDPALAPNAFVEYLAQSVGSRGGWSCGLLYTSGAVAVDLGVAVLNRSGPDPYSADRSPATLCGWLKKFAVTAAAV